MSCSVCHSESHNARRCPLRGAVSVPVKWECAKCHATNTASLATVLQQHFSIFVGGHGCEALEDYAFELAGLKCLCGHETKIVE